MDPPGGTIDPELWQKALQNVEDKAKQEDIKLHCGFWPTMRAIQEALGHIEQKPKEQKEKKDKERDTEEEKEPFSQPWVMTYKSKDIWASLTA
jgi:hypothetical protein